MNKNTDSLYDRIGGDIAVNAAVDQFYERVMNDDSLAVFFDGISMDRQLGKMKIFLKAAMGADIQYTGKDMTVAHAGLVQEGLNDTHVDRVESHLQDTLNTLGVDPDIISEVMALVGSLREDVLGRR